MLIALVADDDHGGVAAEAFDGVEPIFETVFFFALAVVENEEVEAAFGEEELVGGVHNFLSAEVPEVEFDGTRFDAVGF